VNKAVFVVLLAWAVAPCGFPQESTEIEREKAAIRQAALHYLEGWYEGNASRMETALHPELVKRSIDQLPTGRSVVRSLTALTMVEFTRAGGGKNTPKEKQKNEVTVLAVDGDIATAKTISADYIDYLHLVKVDGQWKIINVLWQPKSRK